MREHNRLVRKIEHILKEKFEGCKIILRKGDNEIQVGKIYVETRTRGRPDIIVWANIKLNKITLKIPFFLVEVELGENINRIFEQGLTDFKNFFNTHPLKFSAAIVSYLIGSTRNRDIKAKALLRIRMLHENEIAEYIDIWRC